MAAAPTAPPVQKAPNAPLMAFRLHTGDFIQNDPKTGKERSYKKGETVYSTKNLAKRYPEKFAALDDPRSFASPQEASRSDGLDEMKIEDLKKIAEENEVPDIGKLKTREELIKAIRTQ